MPSDKVTANGKEYTITKLKCKHLRKMTELLAEAKAEKDSKEQPSLYVSLERWMPFIVDSIKVNHPEFSQADVDEMSLEEALNVWNAITTYSAIKFTTGETKPEGLNGDSSTQELHSQPAGPTLQ